MTPARIEILIHELSWPEAVLWIGCGKDDFLLERNQKFTSWLKETGIDHTYKVTEGSHNWRIWRSYLSEFLPLIFQ